MFKSYKIQFIKKKNGIGKGKQYKQKSISQNQKNIFVSLTTFCVDLPDVMVFTFDVVHFEISPLKSDCQNAIQIMKEREKKKILMSKIISFTYNKR